ncbi:Cytosolic Fe-S cluster assembly factor nar1 [Onygenales sp. PD_10]|nr:Cytosolic Fe-S cluster assembly factor nar1 [Onygenales sp. PD_10]
MSAILSADDLNDFISPGVACIKPIETLPKKDSQKEDNAYEVTTEDKVEPENLPPAQISLTDCLACSGCVTSAEAVLVSLQSHAEVLNTLDSFPELKVGNLNKSRNEGDIGSSVAGQQNGAEDRRIFVASVSPQVRASLAATYGISEREAGYLIEQFLSGPQGLRAGGQHGNGFTWVVDTNVMRQVCLELSTTEVAESLDNSQSTADFKEFSIPKRPILSSVCPGWICYAEKTHPHVLPHMSRLKSPQALTGTFLKTMLSKKLNISPSQIWHLAIMPCFDKKLEASRQELTDASWQSSASTLDRPDSPDAYSPVRDVDCVITSRELLMLATSRNISLKNLPLKPLSPSYSPPFPDDYLTSFLFPRSQMPNQSSSAGTSGGYLHHLLTTYQSRNPGSLIQTQRGRNSDVIEYTLTSTSGETIIKAARYYGFRNIQNLVRKLKPARTSRLPGAKPTIGRRVGNNASASATGSATDYAYIEVMACPGGCTNGGGQIRVEDAREINAPPAAAAVDPASSPSIPQQEQSSQKPTPHEQRSWIARVDEAYFSADSDSESDSAPNDQFNPSSSPRMEDGQQDRAHPIDQILSHWSHSTNIPLDKLVYTTFRKVESDVGKNKGKDAGGVGDTARVAELAGKIGGGW